MKLKHQLHTMLRCAVVITPTIILLACGGGGSGGVGSGGSGGTPPPILSGTLTGQIRVVTNQLYDYSATATSNTAANYSWAWGDSSSGALTASAGTQSKVWRAAGDYVASLTITDSTGGTAQSTQTVAVVDHPVSMGNEHSCAILSDNTVACWGNNVAGQLGDGKVANTNVPAVITGLKNVVSLAAYGYSTCAAKSDGTVWCWGFQGYGANQSVLPNVLMPQQISGLTDVVALAGGDNATSGGTHACALQRSGTVQCWGNNDLGELGRGGPLVLSNHTPSELSPLPVVGLTDAVSIAASGASTCAIKADGSVVCWGYGGQNLVKLGVNRPSTTVFAVSSPIPVTGVSNAVSLAMSHFGNGCAVINDGSVKCWGVNGTNYSGQALAQTSTTLMGALPNTLAGINNIAALTLGLTHACALKINATVECWGTYGFRANYNTAEPQATPLSIKDPSGAPLTNVQSVSSGLDHTCASKFDGTVHCWGWNSSGQLGDSTNADHTFAKPVELTGLTKVTDELAGKSIAAGYFSTCVVKTNGQVACWGKGSFGQLGNGSNASSNTPVTVNLQGSVTAVAASGLGEHACALKSSGDVVCWGRGDSGQLGNGSNTNSNLPVSVNIPGGATEISAGATHACALKTDGNVACWGSNSSGQLGVNSQNWNLPSTVNIVGGAIALSAGKSHTCIVKTNGDVACWGENNQGQLGIAPFNNNSSTMVPVITIIAGGAKAVSAGGIHTCAVKTDDSVVCWGYGGSGSLGNGTNVTSYSPVAILLAGGVKMVNTRGYHNCAVRISNEVMCWGQGTQGQLGYGGNMDSNIPTIANLPGPASAVAAGSYHSCSVQTNGDIYCWGSGTLGALGNGSTSNSNTPVKVPGLSSLVKQLTFWK